MSFPHPALSTRDSASRHAACPRPVEAHAVMEVWDAAERSPPTSASSVQKSDAECNVRFTCHFWVCDGLAAKVPSPVGVKGPSWPWRQKLCLESLGHNFCISCLDFVHHRELDYISLMMKATSVFLLWTWASLSIWKSSALALGAKEMCSAWKVRTHSQLKTSPHLQSCCCLGDRKLKRCETRQQRPWNTNSFLCNFFCWDDNTSSFVYLCQTHWLGAAWENPVVCGPERAGRRALRKTKPWFKDENESRGHLKVSTCSSPHVESNVDRASWLEGWDSLQANSGYLQAIWVLLLFRSSKNYFTCDWKL